MKINGLPVVDAAKELSITITPEDVVQGQTKDPGACAIARALLRQSGCIDARVHLGRTYMKVAKKWVKYETPGALRDQIIGFDRGDDFSPGAYTLRPIRPSARSGGRQGSDKPGARDKGSANRIPKKRRATPHTIHGVRPHGANR